MSLSFRSTQVSAPSTSPTLSVSGTGHYIRHRRVNLEGQHSLWSDFSECSSAPVTVTPESYSDATQLLRDEFLYSTDDITYYIIPRVDEIGAQTVSAFTPGSWTVAVNEDTQNAALTDLNFGTFTTSSSPFKRFYLLNEGLNVGSLTFNFIDAITEQVATDYSGLIRVEIEGVFAEFSQAESTAYNDSFLWQSPPRNLNTLGLILPSNSFIQIKVTLTNFPVGSLIQNTVSLSMQVQENLTVFPLSYDSDWALNTFLYDPSKGFDYPFIEASNEGLTLTVKPFLINVNGVLVGRFTDTTFTLASVGEYTFTVSTTGILQIWGVGETIPTNLLQIGTFVTVNSSPTFLTSYQLQLSPKPDTFSYDETLDGTLTNFVIEYYPLSNIMGVCSDPTKAIGVALSRTQTYATSGIILVATIDPTIEKGDFLSCDFGLAIKDTNGFLVALQDEYFGLVLCTTRYNKPASSGSVTANDVTVDTTGFVVTTSTNLQTHLEESDTALEIFADFITAYVSPTLQNLYEAASLIITNVTRGAITFKQGSGSDTDAVFKVKNEAGTDTFVVTGEGEVSTQSLLVGGSEVALKSNVLELDNVEVFIPTLDYHPSTKKYVDDNAGGNTQGKNRLINGNFSVDQRNNGAAQTITAAAAKAYTVDRFYAYCTGANVTGQRVAGSLQSQYRYRFTGAGGNTSIQFGQRIEAANSYDLNDQTCTLSVDLSNSILTTVTWEAFYANTTDTFGTIASPTRTSIATGTFTVTSTIDRYSVQIAVPSAATTGIEIVFSVANQTSGTWTIGNVQFVANSDDGFDPIYLRPDRYTNKARVSIRMDARQLGSILAFSVSFPEMRAIPTASVFTAGVFANISTGTFTPETTNSGRAEIIATAAGDAYLLNYLYLLQSEL